MKEHPEQSDHLLDRFDAWLKDSPVIPDKGFLERTRARLHPAADDLDAAIDSLLRPDPGLSDPNMAAKVRQRLKHDSQAPSTAPWFQWLAPLAAAAMLSLAFISFQMQAPDAPTALAVSESPGLPFPAAAEPDSDLTQIFALAANLHGTADVSSLQSVDNLAYLFE